MPLYEYKCELCGKVFEVMQKFADEPLKTHEECGGAVDRLISAPAFQFKGSGWYVTDYAKGGKSAPNGSSGKDEGPDKSTGKKEVSDKKDAGGGSEKSSKETSNTSSSSTETKSTKSSDTK